MKTISIKILPRPFRIWKAIVVALLLVSTSCSNWEDEMLAEVPLGFYSPENSFVTMENFDAALNNIYAVYRDNFWGNEGLMFIYFGMSDLSTSYIWLGGFWDYRENIGAASSYNLTIWQNCYRIIFDANAILDRSASEQAELTEAQKRVVQAEAYFFRAYAYRWLAHLFGGVPLVLEEVTTPKNDYVRATQQEVYEQIASDLEIAAADLPDINDAPGYRVSNLVASHVLAEIYISLGRYQDAVNETSKVIDHPATALMQDRFGSRATEQPGDVYWDLFRQDNQNRNSGNTEALWTLEFAHPSIAGGGRANDYVLERVVNPYLQAALIKQSNGSWQAVLNQPNTYVGGRGQGYTAPGIYFLGDLWANGGDQDIRNAPYNIVRDIQVWNPKNEYNGQWVLADNLPLRKENIEDTLRKFTPYLTKLTTPGRHPAELWHADQSVPGALVFQARRTWRDHYEIRLAETYLLRAEAYVGLANPQLAANDINAIRARANAPLAAASEVDLDYVLDERMRELHFEVPRVLTLFRMGKTYERMMAYNTQVATNGNLQQWQTTWAIPDEEIQKNKGAELTQNPGY